MRSQAERNNRQTFGSAISVPGSATGGIKVSGVYSFMDIHGGLTIKTAGASDPAFAVYQGGIRQFQFAAGAMNEMYLTFDIPHDHVPGTDVSFHAHWSNGAAVPNTGNVRWGIEWSYAAGFGDGVFSAPATVYFEQASPAVRYTQNTAEFADLGLGGTVGVGGIVIARFFRDAAHINDTCTDPVFAHEVNMHYRSMTVGTPLGEPPFYT